MTLLLAASDCMTYWQPQSTTVIALDMQPTIQAVYSAARAEGITNVRDRIVQIAIIKYPKNGGEPIELEMMINPGIPISEEAMNVHGITPKMLSNKPSFQQVADQLLKFIGDSDLAGYNSNRFDVPMLMEEFSRVGIELDMKFQN